MSCGAAPEVKERFSEGRLVTKPKIGLPKVESVARLVV